MDVNYFSIDLTILHPNSLPKKIYLHLYADELHLNWFLFLMILISHRKIHNSFFSYKAQYSIAGLFAI